MSMNLAFESNVFDDNVEHKAGVASDLDFATIENDEY